MYRISSSATPPADNDVLALAAFSFIGFEVTQVAEYLRIFPDFTKGGYFHVSCGTVEIGAGFHVAKTVDQANCLRSDAPFAAACGKRQ